MSIYQRARELATSLAKKNEVITTVISDFGLLAITAKTPEELLTVASYVGDFVENYSMNSVGFRNPNTTLLKRLDTIGAHFQDTVLAAYANMPVPRKRVSPYEDGGIYPTVHDRSPQYLKTLSRELPEIFNKLETYSNTITYGDQWNILNRALTEVSMEEISTLLQAAVSKDPTHPADKLSAKLGKRHDPHIDLSTVSREALDAVEMFIHVESSLIRQTARCFGNSATQHTFNEILESIDTYIQSQKYERFTLDMHIADIITQTENRTAKIISREIPTYHLPGHSLVYADGQRIAQAAKVTARGGSLEDFIAPSEYVNGSRKPLVVREQERENPYAVVHLPQRYGSLLRTIEMPPTKTQRTLTALGRAYSNTKTSMKRGILTVQDGIVSFMDYLVKLSTPKKKPTVPSLPAPVVSAPVTPPTEPMSVVDLDTVLNIPATAPMPVASPPPTRYNGPVFMDTHIVTDTIPTSPKVKAPSIEPPTAEPAEQPDDGRYHRYMAPTEVREHMLSKPEFLKQMNIVKNAIPGEAVLMDNGLPTTMEGWYKVFKEGTYKGDGSPGSLQRTRAAHEAVTRLEAHKEAHRVRRNQLYADAGAFDKWTADQRPDVTDEHHAEVQFFLRGELGDGSNTFGPDDF